MNNLDISRWQAIETNKIFTCKNTSNVLSRDITPNSGFTPYVTASGINNGVVTYIDASGYETIPGNCILIGGKTFTVTYQEKDFVSNDSHNFIVRAKKRLSNKQYLFLSVIIRNYFRQRFSWMDAITKDKFLKEKIPLPINDNNEPDWTYMEDYINEIEDKAKNKIIKLKTVKGNQTNVNTNSWKRFHLYDDQMFTIDSGNKFDKSKMFTIEPTINFVGRSSINNGITCEVDRVEDAEPYKAGNMTIALGGEYLGSCFIQDKDFYTSQNVGVLIPKWDMPYNVKLFISFVIFKEAQTYYKAFEDELNRHMSTDFSILLPIDSDEVPDWDYMEKFIDNIKKKSKNKIDILKHIVS